MAQFSALYNKHVSMKSILEQLGVVKEESNEDFNWGATIVMIVLLLTFIGTSFYILVSSYLEVS
jgi:hypothetical protein